MFSPTHKNHTYPLTEGEPFGEDIALRDTSVWESSVSFPFLPEEKRVEQSYVKGDSSPESPYATCVCGDQVEGRTSQLTLSYPSDSFLRRLVTARRLNWFTETNPSVKTLLQDFEKECVRRMKYSCRPYNYTH